MPMRIGIVGYGTIGKRVADALKKLESVKVVGVVKTKPDYSAELVLRKGFKLYTIHESLDEFRKKGLEVSGTVEDLLNEVDLVIDATPGGMGRKYKELYVKYGVPAIFQGGEDSSVAEISFSSICNYEEAIDKKYVRVVSCNTTGLLRIVCLLNQEFGVEKVRGVIIRRGADPKEDKRGPINAIKLDPPGIPSHHALDAKTVVPDLDIETIAVAVPTTLMHVHILRVILHKEASRDEVINALAKSKRIILISAEKTGIDSTSKVIEWARDIGRYRYDIPENVIWLDTLKVAGKEVTIVQAIHQESIVIPENIDAVKAVLGLEKDKWKAIYETDKLLGLGKTF
ncbi:MAG: type II glyceraldehyde-3-phosphate dehydrogenase [Thermoprotei archaeon]